MINEIIQGDALTKLRELESESVDCCITSPPYYNLRDYKTEGQIGLEATAADYIQKLIEIFNEVKRVLKSTASCWINMGDSYNGNKSLCLIPERFAIEMIDQGWILRNKIIWYKPNCMPSSARDRFTVDWEYLYFFTKSPRYYFETQYESYISTDGRPFEERCKHETWGTTPKNQLSKYPDPNMKANWAKTEPISQEPNPLGRIKRCVWKIPTQPFSDAHFAVFPPAIVETPLKATCPEYVCRKCGKPREKIMEFTGERYKGGHGFGNAKQRDMNINNLSETSSIVTGMVKEYKENGLSDCGCNAGFDGGIVLDPFIGSGTVGLVAMQNARNFVGIELNPEYIKMAMERLDPYLRQTRIQ